MVSSGEIANVRSSSTSPVSTPASTRMIESVNDTSPLTSAQFIGEVPRYCGSFPACRLMVIRSGTSSTAGCRIGP